jgi:hypothetical protein
MTDDAECMAICAIRYCIGRRSPVVNDGQRWALDWGARSKRVRDALRRDLLWELQKYDAVPAGLWLGDEHDKTGWLDVLAKLDAIAAKEGAP